MICNMFFSVIEVVVNILLAPLSVLNFVIDIGYSISIVKNFVAVIAYLFPLEQLTPLITFIVSMFIFRSIVALIKTIWQLLPFV